MNMKLILNEAISEKAAGRETDNNIEQQNKMCGKNEKKAHPTGTEPRP
jgi:hypothetical protein